MEVLMRKKAYLAILQKGMTQQEIAYKMGCKQPHISDWLNGIRSPSSKNLMKLSDVLEMHPYKLAEILELSKDLS
jgi:transcriptional regulator with XRE-family HTH domain